MQNVKIMNLIILIFGIILLSVNADDPCRTPSQEIGECINLKNCPVLVDVLKQRQSISQTDLDLLRRSQCGFEGTIPKVCCPSQNPQVQANSFPLDLSDSPPTISSTTLDPPDVSSHPNLRLLDHQRCGPITQEKIVGGNKTGVFDFPWMALLGYQVMDKREFKCGGSVINKRYILTAAHCVTNLPAPLELIGVRVGEHDLRTERDCDRASDGVEGICAERYQDFRIEAFHFHPEYNSVKFRNDIGLVRVDDDIDFRPASVRPICLPIGTAIEFTQKKVTVTGWGATELGPRSQDLLKVEVSPVSNEDCVKKFKGSIEIWYKQLCAGGSNGMDSCSGDSGGPLQAPAIYNNNARFVQYGIVSFGTKTCSGQGIPGVYTRISYYTDWILDNMKD